MGDSDISGNHSHNRFDFECLRELKSLCVFVWPFTDGVFCTHPEDTSIRKFKFLSTGLDKTNLKCPGMLNILFWYGFEGREPNI